MEAEKQILSTPQGHDKSRVYKKKCVLGGKGAVKIVMMDHP